MKKLSIIIMMIGLSACNSSNSNNDHTAPSAKTVYTCSMHPEVKAQKPGVCPKCGMELTKESK
jgi:hypothetical protein